MTDAVWSTSWFETGVTNMAMLTWRGVEAQHVVSTMRLVDTAQEQDVLEQLLERSKPPLPVMTTLKHFLLSTPFRYRPQHQSRFRRAGSLGVWYGAEKLFAACAEVAYWRHRFVMDSVPLMQTELLTEHTFFQAEVKGSAVDLMSPPWVKARAAWTHGGNYDETQALADAVKEQGIQWICYESVRATGNRCAAVLDVEALEMVSKSAPQQTWHCKATRERVTMIHENERYDWAF